MRPAELHTQLSAAMASRTLVRLCRRVEAGAADGYVVGVSERWLLLLRIGDGVVYGGFQAFRLQDVTSLDVPSPRAVFHEKVLRKRGLRRPRAPKVSLASAQELVASAGKRFPLVAIHREKADPDVCHIGRVVASSSSSVSLLEITPDAEWHEGHTTYSITQITRVDFGGPYEEALALVAGDC